MVSAKSSAAECVMRALTLLFFDPALAHQAERLPRVTLRRRYGRFDDGVLGQRLPDVQAVLAVVVLVEDAAARPAHLGTDSQLPVGALALRVDGEDLEA